MRVIPVHGIVGELTEAIYVKYLLHLLIVTSYSNMAAIIINIIRVIMN